MELVRTIKTLQQNKRTLQTLLSHCSLDQYNLIKDYTDWIEETNTAISILSTYKHTESIKKDSVPYQLCPKCNGQGTVSKPPYVAGDVFQYSGSSCAYTCDVCNGAKIILEYKVD